MRAGYSSRDDGDAVAGAQSADGHLGEMGVHSCAGGESGPSAPDFLPGEGGESKVRLVGSIAIVRVGVFWICEHLF